jgi:peroxiredoxin
MVARADGVGGPRPRSGSLLERILLGTALVLLVLGAVLFFGKRGGGPQAGQVAPPFNLPIAGGGSASLANAHGQVAVIDFWSLSCGPCMTQMPALADLERRYKDRGVTFYSINTDGGDPSQSDDVQGFARQESLPMTMLLDGDGRVASAYDVEMIPQLFVVGRDGRTAASFTGLTHEQTLADAIDQALQ